MKHSGASQRGVTFTDDFSVCSGSSDSGNSLLNTIVELPPLNALQSLQGPKISRRHSVVCACGTVFDPDIRFCSSCGARRQENAIEPNEHIVVNGKDMPIYSTYNLRELSATQLRSHAELLYRTLGFRRIGQIVPDGGEDLVSWVTDVQHSILHDHNCQRSSAEAHHGELMPKMHTQSPSASGLSAVSCTSRVKKWCGVGSARSPVKELWRIPGDINDGRYNGALANARRQDRLAEESARVAGEFVVRTRPSNTDSRPQVSPWSRRLQTMPGVMDSSTQICLGSCKRQKRKLGVVTETDSRPTTTPRSEGAPECIGEADGTDKPWPQIVTVPSCSEKFPMRSPYDASTLGGAPTGRWILRGGRPHCVQDEPLMLANATTNVPCVHSVPNAQRLPMSSARGARKEDKTQPEPEVMALPFSKSGRRFAPAPASLQTVFKHFCKSKGNKSLCVHDEFLGCSSSYGSDESGNGSSDDAYSDEVERFAKQRTRNKKHKKKTSELAQSCTDECHHTGAAGESRRKITLVVPEDDSTSENRKSSPRPFAKSPHPCARPQLEEIHDILCPLDQPTHTNTSECASDALPRFSWNAISSATSEGHTTESPRQNSKKWGRSTSRRLVSRLKYAATLERSTIRVGFECTPHEETELCTEGRKVEKDLRSEMKRLKDLLLTSAQNTFENDVWEMCGVEAEHLKRQQLAQLIHGGLISQKQKDAEVHLSDGHENSTREGKVNSPGLPSMKRQQSNVTSTREPTRERTSPPDPLRVGNEWDEFGCGMQVSAARVASQRKTGHVRMGRATRPIGCCGTNPGPRRAQVHPPAGAAEAALGHPPASSPKVEASPRRNDAPH